MPGEIHADLLAADHIPDPFDGDNESRLAWIGRTDWSYETRFDWTPNGETRHELVAEGLDTLATLLLNGTEIGRTANEHRTYRFDVSALLVEGTTPSRSLRGTGDGGDRLAAELGDRPRAYRHPFNAIRKMAAGFGWDWGPDAGRRRHLEEHRDRVLESGSGRVRASTGPLDGTVGVLETHVDLGWAEPSEDVDADDHRGRTGGDRGRVTRDARRHPDHRGSPTWSLVAARLRALRRRYPVAVTVGDSRWTGQVGLPHRRAAHRPGPVRQRVHAGRSTASRST